MLPVRVRPPTLMARNLLMLEWRSSSGSRTQVPAPPWSALPSMVPRPLSALALYSHLGPPELVSSAAFMRSLRWRHHSASPSFHCPLPPLGCVGGVGLPAHPGGAVGQPHLLFAAPLAEECGRGLEKLQLAFNGGPLEPWLSEVKARVRDVLIFSLWGILRFPGFSWFLWRLLILREFSCSGSSVVGWAA